MTDKIKLEETIRKLEKKQTQALQSLVKPLSTAFHSGKAKGLIDIKLANIKIAKLKKDKEEKEKLQKEKKQKKEKK